MDLTELQARRRHGIIRLILISSALGFLYPLLAGEWNDSRALLNGIFIGLFGGIIVSVFEFEIFNPQNRKLSFLAVISLKIILYFAAFILIIIGVKGFIDSLYAGKGFLEYINGPEFRYFLREEDFDVILTYTFLVLTIITFTIQMGRKIGYTTLLNMISGKYYTPREEERLFMLLDLKSSTTMAEAFGNLKYHQFLNDFYYDITKCILTAKGEIYRYVGDEIVISWPVRSKTFNSNCLKAYHYVLSEIQREQEKYRARYGLIPEFTTCLHSGNIIVGEIGEMKSQIVFSGEVLSELQHLKKAGIGFNTNLVLSGALLAKIDLPDAYRAIELGMVKTGDQDHKLMAYTLNLTEKTFKNWIDS